MQQSQAKIWRFIDRSHSPWLLSICFSSEERVPAAQDVFVMRSTLEESGMPAHDDQVRILPSVVGLPQPAWCGRPHLQASEWLCGNVTRCRLRGCRQLTMRVCTDDA